MYPLNETECDITSDKSVMTALDAIPKLDWLINCAAYTAVDDCETNEDLATRVNGDGPGILAAYCHNQGIPMIHFSTDYVFDGSKTEMYVEEDLTKPINAYGRSKLAGEKAVENAHKEYLIFRIQWLYGAAGPNFVSTMLKLAETKTELNVVADQFGTPTWTQTICDVVTRTVSTPPNWGTYHLRASGQTNWCEFAQAIFEIAGKSVQVSPIPSEAFPRPAKRPKNSVLNTYKLLEAGFPQLPHWQYCLQQYIGKYH